MKVIIIGASTTGKTTILKHLKQTHNLLIQEADDILTELNGGTYPQDSRIKMSTLAPIMVTQVLNQDQIIFFTNAHYFSVTDLISARNKGFKIILLSLTKKKMLERNKERVKYKGYDDLSKYFDDMILYEEKIIKAGLFDNVIDVNQPIENIISQIIMAFESNL